MIKQTHEKPVTVDSLKDDIAAVGVTSGMTLIVHSSLKSLGRWVAGGPVAVILALEDALGDEGTLVMPTQSGDLSDPAHWMNPPVPESWWETIRQTMPAFDPDLTPTRSMGAIPESFRKQKGVVRSSHPQVSFAARGAIAKHIIDEHSLDYRLGEGSPLARIYQRDGWVLLLGVGHDNNTSLHLAEYRAQFSAKKEVNQGAPMIIDGNRQWVEFKDLNLDDSDFENIGGDFEKETGLVRRGRIADATALLFPQRALVDYAVRWMEKHRK
jgi:aminoglycoside 3-N-acetyltransferase